MGEVKPVAWEGGGLRTDVDGGSVSVEERGNGSAQVAYYDLTPADAEVRAVALLLAAAEAGDGRTAVLNRVVRAMGSPEPQRPAAADVGRMVAQMRDALHMAGDAPWGLLVDTASRLREEVATLREDLTAAEAARAEATQEASRLRVELSEAREALSGKTMHDAAAEAVAPLRDALRECGRPTDAAEPWEVVGEVVEALRSIERDTVAPLREVIAGGSLLSPAALVATAVDMLRGASDA